MTLRILLSVTVIAALSWSSAPHERGHRDASSNLPGAALQQVTHALSGDWNIEFVIAPSSIFPKGGRGRGTEKWRPGPAGLSLIEEYHSQGDDGENSGHGIFWFDDCLGRFLVLWCANDVPQGCLTLSEGATWKNGQLSLQHREESQGTVQLMKEVFSDITPTSFTQTIYVGSASDNLVAQYVIKAARQ